jgi:GTP-binding protein
LKPIVAIIGRPNVGKSTLFNRLIQLRTAIVEDVPGITRDRLYADCEWLGTEFTLVDTGGLDPFSDEEIRVQARRQAEEAVREADLIIFVVDSQQGLHPADSEVAELLRATDKPVVLAVNKVDDPSHDIRKYEFYELGLGDPVPVSAEHGQGTGDLLDRVVTHLPEPSVTEPEPDDAVRVALVGRPNVGKSSLINRLLGEERVIVNEEPGTTRDAVDIPVEYGEHSMLLIDTAGMRRKARIKNAVERYSVLRGLRAIERAHVVLAVLDASRKIAEQDKKIAGYGHNRGKATVFVVNKWDLVEKSDETSREYRQTIADEFSFMTYAPVLFVSAKTGQRIMRLPEAVLEVRERQLQEIPTGELNRIIREAVMMRPPPGRKGVKLRIYYGTQTRTAPPTFLLFVNDPELVHYSYERYLKNVLREHRDFVGTPIRLHFKARDRRGGDKS